MPLFKTTFLSHFYLPFLLTYTDLSFICSFGTQNDDEELRKRGMSNGINQRFQQKGSNRNYIYPDTLNN